MLAVSLLACSMLAASAIEAGEIYSFEIVLDGSATPPGDLGRVTAVLFREDVAARVEIVPYIVDPQANPEQSKIKARDRRFADAEGNCLFTSELRRGGRSLDPVPGEGQEAVVRFNRRIAMPFAALDLPVGVHQVGYVATLFVNNRAADLAVAPLTEMRVTDMVRREMNVRTTIFRERNDVEDLSGMAWREGKLVPVEWKAPPSPDPTIDSKTAAVEIKGEFRRSQFFGAAGAAISSKEWAPESRRIVYFATNRKVVNPTGDIETKFSDDAVPATDQMSYGASRVSIPINAHKPGQIETPGRKWFFWKEAGDPDKHFLVETFEPLELNALVGQLGKDDVLLYVHGYNNTVKDAVLRGGQLQHDLQFVGKMMVFSWPSAGRTLIDIADPFDWRNIRVKTAYGHDEAQAELSRLHLADVIDTLLHRGRDLSSPRKLHLLAHSMGNRVLLNALHALHADGRLSRERPELGHVILAAADIDGTSYSNVRDALIKNSERVTFYYSSEDGALKVSRFMHMDKPIGMSAVFDKDKMDTISAEGLTEAFNKFGHLYVTESWPVLTDVRLLLTRGLAPLQRRPPLGARHEARQLNGDFYWTFQPFK